MRNAIVFGLAVIGAAFSSAQAKTYTLANSSGAPYCETIKLGESGGVAGGVMDGDACKTKHKLIGAGAEARIDGDGRSIWSFGFANGRDANLLLLDQKALTWSPYTGGSGIGYTLQLVNSGLLLHGKQTNEGAPSLIKP